MYATDGIMITMIIAALIQVNFGLTFNEEI